MYHHFLTRRVIRGQSVAVGRQRVASFVTASMCTPMQFYSSKNGKQGNSDDDTEPKDSDAQARDTSRTGLEEGGNRSDPSPIPPSPWDPKRHSQGDDALRRENREAAQQRLVNLFHHDTARRELGMARGGEAATRGSATVARLVLDKDGRDMDDEEEEDVRGAGGKDRERSQGTSEGMGAFRQAGSPDRFTTNVDEDGDAGLVPLRQPMSGLARGGSPARQRLEALEQELLDDDHLFFPPALVTEEMPSLAHQGTPGSTDAADRAAAREREQQLLQRQKERYVPGQQLVPPGLTRYRVDVQYQGSDFDGWYKTSSRKWEVVERLPDGTTRRRPATQREIDGKVVGLDTGVAGEGMQTQHHARTILEDALAVALDVPSVSVVAAVIPETGVSVRRLTCHVDLPSDIEMQPRTIIQRATMWLQSRHQPLAILACHPCKNQDFHARHSGVRRVYCYRILNRIAPPLFDAGLQWHVDRHLDVARMQRFAAAMQGTKDFGFFADPKMANALRRAAMTGSGNIHSAPVFSSEHESLTVTGRAPWEKTPAPKVALEKGLSNLERAAALPTFNEYGQQVRNYSAKPKEYFKAQTNLPTVRTIDTIDVVRQEDEVLIWFVGKSFLRHQIRNMVSVLKASGHGLWDEQELQHAFQTGFEVSRKKFKRERLPPAPAYGLTLWDVEYPRQHRDDFVPLVDSGPYEEVDISAVN